LIAKNPEIQQLVASGHTFSPEDEKNEYSKIVQRISTRVVMTMVMNVTALDLA